MDPLDLINTVLLAVIAGSMLWLMYNLKRAARYVMAAKNAFRKGTIGKHAEITPWPPVDGSGVLEDPIQPPSQGDSLLDYLHDLACASRTVATLLSHSNQSRGIQHGARQDTHHDSKPNSGELRDGA